MPYYNRYSMKPNIKPPAKREYNITTNIDVVPVIRCRKCKHYQEWDDNPPTCRMWTDQWDMPTEPNGYCHYGELKE